MEQEVNNIANKAKKRKGNDFIKFKFWENKGNIIK
ncbi:hypothetical protein P872_04780 [Rhodonellum psychrophilum GCM71 = DSM 17998]|uniref:Uncharacterized protein n=1 Tax=Rhodonellum psychrophilum GCM71 = DSM 17998 TaxID=1123057 RepID=U5C1Z1_9BACT|nr:hypothetical protein P872_04780 [Rhodonellum psychrophilum GCM71 = DSM 17998]